MAAKTFTGEAAALNSMIADYLTTLDVGATVLLTMEQPKQYSLYAIYAGAVKGAHSFTTLPGELIAAGMAPPPDKYSYNFAFPGELDGRIRISIKTLTETFTDVTGSAGTRPSVAPWTLAHPVEIEHLTARIAEHNIIVEELRNQSRASSYREQSVEQVATKTNTELISDLAMCEGRLAACMAQVDQMRAACVEKDKQIATMMATARSRMADLAARPDPEKGTAIIQLQYQMLLRDHEELLGAKEALDLKLIEVQGVVTQRDVELITAASRIRALQSECDSETARHAALSAAHEAEIAELQHRSQIAAEQLREAVLSSRRTSEASPEPRRGRGRLDPDRLQTKLAEAEAAVAHALGENAALTRELEAATADLRHARAHATRLTESNAQTLARETARYKALQEQLEQVQGDHARTAGDSAFAERTRTELRAARDELLRVKADLLSAQGQVRTLEHQLADAEDDAHARLAEAQAKTHAATLDVRVAVKKSVDLSHRVTALEAQLAEATAELEQRRRADDASRTVPKPRVTVAVDVDRERAALQNRITELEEVIVGLDADLVRARRDQDDEADKEVDAAPATGNYVYLCETTSATQTSLGPAVNIHATQFRHMEQIGRRLDTGLAISEADRAAFFAYKPPPHSVTLHIELEPWHLPDWVSLANEAISAPARVRAVMERFSKVALWTQVTELSLAAELEQLVTAFFNTAIVANVGQRIATQIFTVFERSLAYIHARARRALTNPLATMFSRTDNKRVCERINAMAVLASAQPASGSGGGGKGGGGGRSRGGGGKGSGKGGGGSPGGSPGLSSSLSSTTPTKQGNGKGGGQSA